MKRAFFIFLLCAASLCADAGQARRVVLHGVSYVYLRDVCAMHKLTMQYGAPWVVLNGPGVRVFLRPDHRKILFNNLRLDLNLAPRVQRGQPLISVLDWEKTLRPLLEPDSLLRHRVWKITIDMGHGGKDPGAQGRYSREKDINLRLGLRLAQVLQACGFQVALTRTRDTYIPLEQVGHLQQLHRSDLFVSLHVNSAINRTLTGIETFCITPCGAQSSNAGKSAQGLFYPGNRFDANNLALACRIQRALLRRTRAVDRGVKHARYVVLRNLNAPGVLVETGFLSNAAEEARLNKPAYQEQLVRGIAEGIIAYQRSLRRNR